MATQETSIKRKVMTAIMLTVVTVLLVMIAAFMVYDLLAFRQTMMRNLTTQGRIVAENSTAALAFKNENDARNVLYSLDADPHIKAAALYGADGKLFVKYPAQISNSDLPTTLRNEGTYFERSRLILLQPVIQDGRRLGTLYLQSDLNAISARLELYAGISIGILLGSLLIAFWLSHTMQKRIADPIIALAGTAQKISGRQDYSMRAEKLSNDELGMLTDSFNEMLSRIQASDSALRASEAQLRLVTDQAPVLLAHMDRNYRYKFVNQPYAARYGRQPHEVVGRHAVEIVGLELFEKARPQIERVLADESVQFELEIPDGKQSSRWSHVEYTPEHAPSGEVIGFVAVHTDITARKRVEMELERARDQALAAARAKDDFLAALSHELRTPLNPVLLLASEAVTNVELPPEVRNTFEIISKNVALEARLIDDLLDLTRITRNKLSLDLQTTDVHDVLQNTIDTVRGDIERKRIVFTADLKAQASIVLGDAVRLQQIFWNVLKNAIKFTAEDGKISLETLTEKEQLIVKISDTGIGLTDAELKRVFDAFVQGDHSIGSGSHRFGGLGLGLAISQKLAQLHLGIIRASSEGRDKGATFAITLPLLSAAETEKDSQPTQPVFSNLIPQLSAGHCILLVEDHEPTRTALAHLLSRRHFEVVTAASVAEARHVAGNRKIDLLISDIGLPDGDGYNLMIELKKLYGLKGIALTGYGMEEDIARSQKSGFAAHLTKPVHVRALENALAVVATVPYAK